jgi:hypothetical protein
MNLISKSFVVLFFLLAAFAGSLMAQDFPIKYTHTAPIVDGIEDDEWANHRYEFLGKKNLGTITSAYDLSGTFRFCWDDANLYLLVVVVDDELHTDNSADIWTDDGIEIYLDINNDKATSYGADDYQYCFRYNDAVIYETKHNKVEGVTMAQVAGSGGVVYEIKVPWSTLGGTNIANGAKLGFDIHLNDDDGGVRDGKMAWVAINDQSYLDPSKLGTVVLDGKGLLEQVDSPDFSNKRGFYEGSFYLTLTSTVDGGTIFYTMDGSDPRYSTTAVSGASPQTVSINPASATNRGGITPGVVVRAITKKEGYVTSKVKTHSFMFVESVKTQSNPGGIWPKPYVAGWGLYLPQSIDYNMDPDVVNNAAYSSLIDDALTQIPSISLVTDNKNFFDVTQGFYMNPIGQGSNWERPVSVELMNPDGSDGFQIDAGVRLRGGYSRYPSNAKHSFRLFFSSEYGEKRLKHRLFEREGTNEFAKLDLSTAQNYSWSKDGSSQNNFMKDMCFRDIQGKMGHHYTRSRYYHLYLNGVYWGLFHSQERPEANFAESYMGGDEDDYDVVKPERNLVETDDDLKIVATEGSLDAAERLWNKMIAGFTTNQSYYEVQGLNTDGSRNMAYERLLDIDNLIDYIQIAYYSGSYDAPISGWSVDPTRPNNYFSIYNRNNPDGFKWFVHDFEHTMNNKEDHGVAGGLEENWIVTRTLANFNNDLNFFNPVQIHLKLMKNPEYKIKFADHAFRNLTKGGYLSPDSVLAVFGKRKAQIDMAIIAESARWGDTKSTIPKTKADWVATINSLEKNYIPFRSQVVINLLKTAGMYPSINPPKFELGGVEPVGHTLSMTMGAGIKLQNSNGTTGTIWYTTDGSDPRVQGGGVNKTAIDGGDLTTVTINANTNLKARVLNGTTWSALHEKILNVSDPFADLRITEIHYNPLPNASVEGSQLEFIELKNVGNQTINLTGLAFTTGVQYTFEGKLLEPGKFVVLASNQVAFNAHYGFLPDGQYVGNLNNGGELVVLANSLGVELISLTYAETEPWPIGANGFGNSMVSGIHNPSGDPALPGYWKASSRLGGSPGQDDPEPLISPIIITEVLLHSDDPYRDAIELYNPSNAPVDISNWFLTDLIDLPQKWKIPAGTIVPANGYRVIFQGHYVNGELEFYNNEFGSAFGLSEYGDFVYLISADAAGNYTGYSTGLTLGASDRNVSFGRYVNSVGDVHFVAQNELTLGSDNSDPRVGPLVFNQIMYNPNVTDYEYLEIKNTSASTVNLYTTVNMNHTWKIGGVDFQFPPGISLEAGASLYLIQSDVLPAVFREKYKLATNIQIFNMVTKLSNSGESIKIWKAGDEYLDGGGLPVYTYILVEEVLYSDLAPWPVSADGLGAGLLRLNLAEYGNDPINWGENFPTAIDQPKRSGETVVYPNPSKGLFNVAMTDVITHGRYNVVNAQGQKVLEGVADGPEFVVDLGGAASGVYLLLITHDAGTQTIRLVVN